MKYELTPDLMTGNQLVDREHKELLEAVNRLQQFLVFPVYQLVARHQIGRQFVFHLNDLLCIIFWI